MLWLAIVAATVRRIDEFSVNTEKPAPWGVYISRLLDVHNIVSSRSWKVEEVTNVSTIEAWLKGAIGSKMYHVKV